MKRWIAILATLLASCSADDGTTCEMISYDGTEYCVYEGAITETGYDCPPEMENMFRDDQRGLVVCSADMERPPFAEILDELEGGGPDEDAAPNNPMLPNNVSNNSPCMDEDGDGFGVGNTQNCPRCLEVGLCEEDCDDTDPAVAPNMIEICDGADNDCDGTIDEPLECESVFDCPDEGGKIPSCENGSCTYKPPIQVGNCSGIVLMCLDGVRETSPDECL